jgi:hypothetical protein
MSKGKTNFKIEKIISDNFFTGSPHSFDVNVKREEFSVLLGQLKEKRGLAKKLGVYDCHYLSAEGVYEFTNVKAGRASFGPTARAVIALQQLVDSEDNVSKRVGRKKLVTGAMVVMVWGMLLGLTIAPATAQRLNDGCMKAVVEDPQSNTGTSIIMSGLVFLLISTVAAMWWYDYENRKLS